MALIPNTNRRNDLSFYNGSNYTPETIGSFVAVTDRDTPWNTIGTALEGSAAGKAGRGKKAEKLLTAREALAMAGIDITVLKVPVLDAETGTPIPKLFATCYDDPESGRQYFGAVKDTYTVAQPVEALTFFDDVIHGRHGAHYSAAWGMKEKSQIGVTIEFPDSIVIDPGGAADTLGLYGLGFNSFDGSTGLGFVTTTVRFWCMNQLPPIMRLDGRHIQRGVSFKHTSNVLKKVADAQRAIGVAYDWAKAFDKIANSMHAKKCSDRQFEAMLNNLAPFVVDTDASSLVQDRARDRREMVLAEWRAPHNANITGTRWGAYNVVAEYADWGRRVVGSHRTGTDAIRQRAIGTLVHPTVFKIKNTMFDLCAA